MAAVQVESMVKEYLLCVSNRDVDSHMGFAFNYESDRAKLKTYRGKQLSTFLYDAKFLKSIENTQETSCSSPSFKANAIQYYFLEANELINYFSFRTILKKGKVPKNNYHNFLALYAMEIINDLYGDTYGEKYKILEELVKLYPKGVKYRNIIMEAFEILYFQNMDALDFDKYCTDSPIKIFKGVSFISDIKIYEACCVHEGHIPPLDVILKLIDFDKYMDIGDAELYLLQQSFSYLMVQLDMDENFKFCGNRLIARILECRIKDIYDFPYIKLRAIFPLTCNTTYTRKNGDVELIRFGVHSVYKDFYDDYDVEDLQKFFKLLIKTLGHHCGGEPLMDLNNDSLINHYISFYQHPEKDPVLQKTLSNAVAMWVEDNPYAFNGFKYTKEELECRKQRDNFKLDISDVKKVRVQSSNIQDRLIVEENESSIIKSNKVLDSPTPKAIEDVKLTSNEFEQLILKLQPWENKILSLLTYNHDIEAFAEIAIEAAAKMAIAHGTMLSIVEDYINTLSNELIGDVIIIDDGVAYYEDEVKKALNKQYK